MVTYLNGAQLDFSKEMLFMLTHEEYMRRTWAAWPGRSFWARDLAFASLMMKAERTVGRDEAEEVGRARSWWAL